MATKRRKKATKRRKAPVKRGKSDQIARLLQNLKKSGAVVRRGSPRGTPITNKVLSDLKTRRLPDFTAWVTWTLRF